MATFFRDRFKPKTPAAISNKSSKPKSSFFQQQHKAGLHVTAEWENACQECKVKVAGIAKRCRIQNRKFRDIEFDIDTDQRKCLYGVNLPGEDEEDEVYNPTGVMRLTEIFDQPQFFVGGAHASDIAQGALGDCWFLSALATMSASKERLVEQFCVASDPEVGVYGFVFFRDMIPVTVIVDDMLYVSIPKYAELSSEEKLIYHNDEDEFNKNARKGGKILYFSKSGNEGEAWVPLVEKAFAKLHGDYASLSGGITGEAIEDMSGGVTFWIQTKDILDRDRFWKDELKKANTDRLFACAMGQLDTSRLGSDYTVRGIFTGHAYSVIRAVEFRGKRFVVVRNPWGKSEWTGRWSDGSKEWTREWLPALDALEYSFGDDGQFVMEYDDFLRVWDSVDRTLLFDDNWVLSSHWLKVTSHSLPSAWTFGDVSFTFSLPSPSYTVLVLSQLDNRYFTGLDVQSNWSFDFVLFKKGETEEIAPSLHSRFYARSVNLEVDLDEGDYVLHVRLDRQLVDQSDERVEKAKNWNQRKLSRVLTERSKSQSIAANFRLEERADSLPVPLEELAGKDIQELEQKAMDAIEEMIKQSEMLHIQEEKAAAAEGGDQEAEEEEEEETNEKAGEGEGEQAPDGQGGPEASGSAPEEQAPPVPSVFDDDDTVYLGLHVYTNKDAPSKVDGQLRHELGIVFHGIAATSL